MARPSPGGRTRVYLDINRTVVGFSGQYVSLDIEHSPLSTHVSIILQRISDNVAQVFTPYVVFDNKDKK